MLFFILRILLALFLAIIARAYQAYPFGMNEWELYLSAIVGFLFIGELHALIGEADAPAASIERVRKAARFLRTTRTFFRSTTKGSRATRPAPAE